MITQLYMADVGDGLCLGLRSCSGRGIHIDCGDQGGGSESDDGLDRAWAGSEGPSAFVLSHFHRDHYSGIIRRAGEVAEPRLIRRELLAVEEVVYPLIPATTDGKAVFHALQALNSWFLWHETGFTEYDFLSAMQKCNGPRFKKHPVSKGDSLSFGETKARVLWPPKVISDPHFPKRASTAIKAFEEAMETDPKLRQLYDRVQSEALFDKYFKPEHEEGQQERPQKNGTEEKKQVGGKKQPRVSKAITVADKKLREVANHLSLALLFDDGQLIFFGDLEKENLEAVVPDLVSRGDVCFGSCVTPHHGTHWCDALRDLLFRVVLSSLGSHMAHYLKPGWKQAFNICCLRPPHLTTWSEGDISLYVPAYPTRPTLPATCNKCDGWIQGCWS